MTKRLGIHFYPSTIKYETRIMKQVNSLLKLNFIDKAIVVGIRSDHLPREEDVKNEISILRLKIPFWKKYYLTDFIRLLIFSFKGYSTALKLKLTYVTIHSVWMLPLGILLKKKQRCILVYDAQELETEKAGFSRITTKAARLIERKFIRDVDSVLTTSESIQTWYLKQYNLKKVYLLRNIPEKINVQIQKSSYFRNTFSIPQSSLIFIYHGLMSKGRGIETLIQCFEKLGSDFHLIFMGYGPLQTTVVEAARVNSNIHFHEAVVIEELQKYVSGADVGIFPIQNVSLSYYLCLPNKIFEFLFSGLPVISSDFPEISKVIKLTNSGWLVKPDFQDIYGLINNLKYSDITEKKPDLQVLSEIFNWEKEAHCLYSAYQN